MLNSRKADFISISASGGYNSAATKTALRNAIDALPSGAIRFGRLSAGDQGILIAMNAGEYVSVAFYLRYGGSASSKGYMASMTRYNGTWGDWVTIFP